MLTIFCIVVWYLAGLAGSVMAWADDIWFDSRLDRVKPVYCPSPLHILLIMLFATSGIVALIVGPLLLWTSYVVIYPKPRGWWRRPICQNKSK